MKFRHIVVCFLLGSGWRPDRERKRVDRPETVGVGVSGVCSIEDRNSVGKIKEKTQGKKGGHISGWADLFPESLKDAEIFCFQAGSRLIWEILNETRLNIILMLAGSFLYCEKMIYVMIQKELYSQM